MIDSQSFILEGFSKHRIWIRRLIHGCRRSESASLIEGGFAGFL